MSKVHGGLLVVACDLQELTRFFGTSSIPALRHLLANLEIQSVPDALSLPSLAAGYLKSGDILAMPMGTLSVSKAINGDAVGMRTGCQSGSPMTPTCYMCHVSCVSCESCVSVFLLQLAMPCMVPLDRLSLNDYSLSPVP